MWGSMGVNVIDATVVPSSTAVRLTMALLWNPESTLWPLLLNRSTRVQNMYWHLTQDR